jgi:hypothetical protein
MVQLLYSTGATCSVKVTREGRLPSLPHDAAIMHVRMDAESSRFNLSWLNGVGIFNGNILTIGFTAADCDLLPRYYRSIAATFPGNYMMVNSIFA